MEIIGHYLMIGGIALLVIGGLIFLSGKLDLPLGRLPGDICIEGENFRFYFPLTSGLLNFLDFDFDLEHHCPVLGEVSHRSSDFSRL